jgi:hypothetical protein
LESLNSINNLFKTPIGRQLATKGKKPTMMDTRSSPSTQAEVVNPDEQALSLCHFCDPENPAKWHCDSSSSALFCDSC